MNGCEVVSVLRNVTDSFRVGEDGCTNDINVCSSSSTCQNDSGLCLCNNETPNFQYPFVESSNKTIMYNCKNDSALHVGVGKC